MTSFVLGKISPTKKLKKMKTQLSFRWMLNFKISLSSLTKPGPHLLDEFVLTTYCSILWSLKKCLIRSSCVQMTASLMVAGEYGSLLLFPQKLIINDFFDCIVTGFIRGPGALRPSPFFLFLFFAISI